MYYFYLISKFHYQNTKDTFFQKLGSKVWTDLDMELFFPHIDFTITKYGRQRLYSCLMTIENWGLLNQGQKETITQLHADPYLSKFIDKEFANLSKRDSYNLCDLFQKENTKPKRSNKIILNFLFVDTFSCILISFYISHFILLAILLILINFVIFYWNKINVFVYSETFVELSDLLSLSKKIYQTFPDICYSIVDSTSFVGLDSIIRKGKFFKYRTEGIGDLGVVLDTIVDLIKGFSLIEVILYFSMVESIQKESKNIEKCFLLIANLDLAQSILSLRQSNPLITVPNETFDSRIIFRDIWHPMIKGAVKNDFETLNSGILLTGANMSGKSTFLRTIGINCLLAHTINCVFASNACLPKMKIFTSIQTVDSLTDEKSFFFSEAINIKQMLIEMENKERKLFLIDEIFKGTNFLERMNISSEVLNYLSSEYSIVIVLTHDRELSDHLPNFKVFYFTGVETNSGYKYDYVLREGVLERTNAIFVLRDMGYPEKIVSKVLDLNNKSLPSEKGKKLH